MGLEVAGFTTLLCPHQLFPLKSPESPSLSVAPCSGDPSIQEPLYHPEGANTGVNKGHLKATRARPKGKMDGSWSPPRTITQTATRDP
jgi:hypothetical protein